jgi:hypothetical protein
MFCKNKTKTAKNGFLCGSILFAEKLRLLEIAGFVFG